MELYGDIKEVNIKIAKVAENHKKVFLAEPTTYMLVSPFGWLPKNRLGGVNTKTIKSKEQYEYFLKILRRYFVRKYHFGFWRGLGLGIIFSICEAG